VWAKLLSGDLHADHAVGTTAAALALELAKAAMQLGENHVPGREYCTGIKAAG
jgi:hypothetical protein